MTDNTLFFILLAIPIATQQFLNNLNYGLLIDLLIIIGVNVWKNKKAKENKE